MTRPDPQLYYGWRPRIEEDSWTGAILAGLGILVFIVAVFVGVEQL